MLRRRSTCPSPRAGGQGDLGQLAPAVTIEIASASVSVAGDMAGDVVDAGSDILENSDQIVEMIAEALPGASVVGQVWDVVLAPGRFRVKAATMVLRRGDVRPPERGGPDDLGSGADDSSQTLRSHLGPIRLELVTPDIGRPSYRAARHLTPLSEEPPPLVRRAVQILCERGSASKYRTTRSQARRQRHRVRALSPGMPLRA
jgi:hypothetical protein